MKFFLFLKSKLFWKQVLIAAVSIIIILFLTFKWLSVYTKHGESVTVPDLKGMSLNSALELLDNQHFRYVIDSVYNDKFPPGTVMEQEPTANSQVKENRTIYLTIVSIIPPSVKLPDLIDVSYREAAAIVESYGLRVGQLIYKPDLAQNAVLGIIFKGKEIEKGFLLPKGSAIDLILGDGYGNTKVLIPNLIGLAYDEALFVLQGSKLNIGSVIFDNEDTDTVHSKIYKQSPDFSTDTAVNKISQGEAIDIYLRKE
jgi:eukaryotic-like serine/threonine-protein kinase